MGGNGGGNGGQTIPSAEAILPLINGADPARQQELVDYYNSVVAGRPGYTMDEFWRKLNGAGVPEDSNTNASTGLITNMFTMPYDAGRSPYAFSRGTYSGSPLDFLDAGLKKIIK